MAPQHSATQPEQKQHHRLYSSHGRKPLSPFHSSAHGAQRSNRTTCWCAAPPQLRVSRSVVFFILPLSLRWVARCHTQLVERDIFVEKKMEKRKIGGESATAIYVRGWLQLIGCSTSSSAQKWWMWTVESDTSTKDEWSVIFSAVSSVKSWTLHHILLFYEAHCSCTHIFSASIIWSGNTLMSPVIKKTQQAFSTSSLTAERAASYLNVDIWTWE